MTSHGLFCSKLLKGIYTFSHPSIHASIKQLNTSSVISILHIISLKLITVGWIYTVNLYRSVKT